MFRNTIFTLTVLSLSFVTMGCMGGAGGGEHYIGYENGQHFGDDSWIDNPLFMKPGTLATFPLNGSAMVDAGNGTLVAFRSSGTLIVGGVDVPAYQLGADGSVSLHGDLIGRVVYTDNGSPLLGTAIVSVDGDQLHIDISGAQPVFVGTGVFPTLASHDQAPRNELDLPVAQP